INKLLSFLRTKTSPIFQRITSSISTSRQSRKKEYDKKQAGQRKPSLAAAATNVAPRCTDILSTDPRRRTRAADKDTGVRLCLKRARRNHNGRTRARAGLSFAVLSQGRHSARSPGTSVLERTGVQGGVFQQLWRPRRLHRTWEPSTGRRMVGSDHQ
uniref:Uncharacterized protein n=1 Tax=Anopheles atroparvus TaxID=41427 RepID=A0AAG5D454_ANOAO